MSDELNVTAVITVEDRGATPNLEKIESGVHAVDKAIDSAGKTSGTAAPKVEKVDKAIDQTGKDAAGAAPKIDASTAAVTGLGTASAATSGRLAVLGRSLDAELVKAKAFGAAYSKALDARTSTRADLAGVGLLAAGGATVWASARFQKETSALKAFSNASQAEMDAMTTAATRQALANTNLGYTAGEAVQAETELAKAGVSAASIIGGGLNGTLALAATEGMAVGEAATYMSDTLNTFNLTGTQATRVADTLAAGSAASSTSVAGLAQSLAQAGLVANQTNLSIEDTVGVLSAFAQNGLKGSDAGTSLRTMLLRLNPVSNEAAAAIDQYNLSAYDAQGNFIGMAAFAGKLQAGLKDLSTEQRNQVLQTVYGQDAIRAATVLYGLGAQGVDQWTDSVSKSGEAQRMASEQTDNLYGDLNKLKAAIDGTLIKSGQGGNDTLRSMTQSATTLVRGVSALPAPVLEGAAAITFLTGATILAVPRIAAFREAAKDIGGIGKVIKGVGIGLGVGMLAVAGTQAAGLKSEADGALETLRAIRGELNAPTSETSLSQAITSIRQQGDALQAQWDGISGSSPAGWWNALTGALAEMGSGNFDPSTWFDKLAEGSANAQRQTTTYQAAVGDLAFKLGTTGGAAQDLLDKYVASGHAVDLLTGNYHDIADAVKTWTADTYAGATAADTATTAVDHQSAALQRQAIILAAANGWVDHQKAIIGYQAALDAASASNKKNGDTLSVHTEKGRANRSALLAIADAAKAAWTQTDKDGTVTITNAKRYDQATKAIADQAHEMGRSWPEARKLARQIMGVNTELDKTGKKKPKPKATLDQTDARTGAKVDITSKLTIIEQHLTALDGRTATVGVRLSLTGGGAPSGTPRSLLPPGKDPTDPLGVWGDTTYSKAHGTGMLGRTLAAHARHSAGLTGLRISNALVGGGGHGYGSGDHQAGRALDVVGDQLGEYIRRVRAEGGFAEIHGSGPGRHAHSVPAGDTTTSRARAGGGGGSTVITVPVTVVGEVGADQVVGLTSAITSTVEQWQRNLTRRGTG